MIEHEGDELVFQPSGRALDFGASREILEMLGHDGGEFVSASSGQQAQESAETPQDSSAEKAE